LKKAIPIFFLAIYLLSTTQLIELLKLPILFEHYREHSQINKNLSIIAFLDIHYAQPTIIDDDYDKDMQLPFKSLDCFSNPLAFYFNQVQLLGLSPKVQYTSSTSSFNSNQFFCSSAFLSTIWQPPKFY
jgi:hypothetical protein